MKKITNEEKLFHILVAELISREGLLSALETVERAFGEFCHSINNTYGENVIGEPKK